MRVSVRPFGNVPADTRVYSVGIKNALLNRLHKERATRMGGSFRRALKPARWWSSRGVSTTPPAHAGARVRSGEGGDRPGPVREAALEPVPKQL